MTLLKMYCMLDVAGTEFDYGRNKNAFIWLIEMAQFSRICENIVKWYCETRLGCQWTSLGVNREETR